MNDETTAQLPIRPGPGGPRHRRVLSLFDAHPVLDTDTVAMHLNITRNYACTLLQELFASKAVVRIARGKYQIAA